MNLYNYEAKILRIVDGDTVNLEMDLGMKIYFKTNCRLSKINAPELSSTDPETRLKAQASKTYLSTLLPINSIVYLKSTGLDKYGRSLAEIITKEGLSVNDEMVRSGHAVIY